MKKGVALHERTKTSKGLNIQEHGSETKVIFYH